jgi:hypothetical protein
MTLFRSALNGSAFYKGKKLIVKNNFTKTEDCKTLDTVAGSRPVTGTGTRILKRQLNYLDIVRCNTLEELHIFFIMIFCQVILTGLVRLVHLGKIYLILKLLKLQPKLNVAELELHHLGGSGTATRCGSAPTASVPTMVLNIVRN